jgi:GT2 family glycosyltransferase
MSLCVVTPSYNQGQFIERTIRSVLEQGLRVEYVVFDALSNDGTLDVLKKYEDRLKWVSEKDRGQSHAVNKGFRATQADIIGWLNSDDIFYPGAFQTVLNYFEEHPEVDMIYGNANHIGIKDEILEPYPTEDWAPERLMETCYICQPATFFRRRVLERIGILDETLHYVMDYDYWLRMAANGIVCVHLPVLLAGSRMYAENKTLGGRVKMHAEINNIFIKHTGKVPEGWIFNYAHAVLDDRKLPRTAYFRFSLAVVAISLWAALKWNHHISKSMLVTCKRWLRASVRRH